ncbi:MAG TPA: M56 family metallopeptidase [Bryobacteraceae bacterium]|nr:M56 family metallopeptidase [Bryobacteraceae bacterium]
MNALLNHLWQSTAFAAAVAIAAVLLRRHSPRLRYWLWLAASVKFLIPFSLIVATGARVQLPPDTPSLHATTVRHVSLYFSPAVIPAPAHASFSWTEWLTAIWMAGAIFLLIRWAHRWITIRRIARTARRVDLEFPAPAFVSAGAIEPGVFGILRPILLLPQALRDELTSEQFDAILAHESRHIQFRDNLTAALHMLVETLFWFHPLVWWIGARLTDERERDCDEAALRQGSRPAEYARSIVSVCQNYTESPLLCASGISGADLKKRIREIMTWRGSLPITRLGQMIIAFAALAAVCLPFVLGIVRAQTLPPEPALTYDAVSIHKSAPGNGSHVLGPGPQGGLRAVNMPVTALIAAAYHVQNYQILDAPGWASDQGFDIIFTPDRSETALNSSSSLKSIQGFMDRNAMRLQSVLRDRFGLVLRSGKREMPIYRLVQAKGGARLSPHAASGPASPPSMSSNGRQITGRNATAGMLAQQLSMSLNRPVQDETHLEGQFDFKVSPESDGPMSESLFTALPEQLGLKLESSKAPVQAYVVEKVEPPTEN